MSVLWWKKRRAPAAGISPEKKLKDKYRHFRELLRYNHDSLELLACLQQDLQYVAPQRRFIENRLASVFQKAAAMVDCLEKLTGCSYPDLAAAIESQRTEAERYIAGLQERPMPRLAAWLSELNSSSAAEAGGKTAVLGEIHNRLGLPVPNGYVLTTEAYRQFVGIPLWRPIRDELRDIQIDDVSALREASESLMEMVLDQPLPRAVEVAILERARWLAGGAALAVRSSSVGEGGADHGRTYAGQFLTLLNVPEDQLVDAYRRVVAARFSEQAIFYRLTAGLPEVDSPMAVLFLPMLRARASGVMYTCDPADPKGNALWITATRGLGVEVASGRMPADLFVLARTRPYALLDRHVVPKEEILAPAQGGGIARLALSRAEAEAPSLGAAELETLADWGLRLEAHFGIAQDVEWVLDEEGKLWVVQARPLALADSVPARNKTRIKGAPVLSGGRTIFPGRVSGPAWLAEDARTVAAAPDGAIVFVRRPSPELVPTFTRIGGLVAEWGNVAGHSAALLREFKLPSAFLMPGAFERLKSGEPVSLDAVQGCVYPGELWPRQDAETPLEERPRARREDPVYQNVLALNLVDASAMNFRPSGCRSVHDVIRFCHEQGVRAMFTVNDLVAGREDHGVKRLQTSLPVDVYVLDLGGGLSPESGTARAVTPEQVVSRPFQKLWKGLSHPGVTWARQMPASIKDIASVMASALAPPSGSTRVLGEKSYLLVAEEYLNFNSRLAFHFTLVDACLTDVSTKNYIAFRFAGGGATWRRRNLRACFIESCLAHCGFHVDRRGDLVNAWYKRAPAQDTGEKLDILGRLMACTCQLDMYMQSYDVMNWYVQQFLEGNYSFQP